MEPRRYLGLLEQSLGDVAATGGRQRRQHERRAEEAGADREEVGAHHPFQLGAHPLPHVRVLDDVEPQGECIRGGGVRDETPVGGEVLVAERGADVGCERRVPGSVVVAADHGGGVGNDLGGACVERGGDQVDRGGRLPRLVRRCGRVEPVAELEDRVVPEVWFGRASGDVVDPRPHAGELGAEQLDVTRAAMDVPGDEGRCIAPTCGDLGQEHTRDRRDDDRHGAVVTLLATQVCEPPFEQPAHVVQVAGGRAEREQVTGPTESLVALGTVRGQVDEVAAHRPHDVVVEALQQLVRALEGAGALHVGVDDDRLEGRRVQVAGPTVDLDVAESVEGELRLPGGRAVSVADEPVGRLGGPQRTGGQLAVLEHLGVAERDHLPRGRVGGAAHPADQVLAEVKDRQARGAGQHVAHGHELDAAHGGTDRGDELADPRCELLGGAPLGCVETDGRPAVLGRPGVQRLAVVEICGTDRPGRRRPRRIRRDRADLVVLERHLELSEHPEPVAVLVAMGVHAEVAAPPPVGDLDTDDVRARVDHRADMVDVVAEAVRVRGPARCQDVVADALPVQLRSVDAR